MHTNCREIIDNVVDMAHFFYIHGSLPTQFKNIFEGHVATQYMNSAGRPDLGEHERKPDVGHHVRCLLLRAVIHDRRPHVPLPRLDHHTVLINCHYPIDANSFVLQYGIIVKKSDALPEDVAMQTAIAPR